MKKVIEQLDRMVQNWAIRQKSEISGQYGCVAHHIVGRANHYLRFDKENLFVCTPQEHDLIHRGILKVETYISPKRLGNLRDKKLKSLTWKPNDEFYQREVLKWKNYQN